MARKKKEISITVPIEDVSDDKGPIVSQDIYEGKNVLVAYGSLLIESLILRCKGCNNWFNSQDIVSYFSASGIMSMTSSDFETKDDLYNEISWNCPECNHYNTTDFTKEEIEHTNVRDFPPIRVQQTMWVNSKDT